jgi:hypothetical protein
MGEDGAGGCQIQRVNRLSRAGRTLPTTSVMLIVRFKARCLPDKTEEVLEAMTAIIAPSRAMPGVINFDIGRDITAHGFGLKFAGSGEAWPR